MRKCSQSVIRFLLIDELLKVMLLMLLKAVMKKMAEITFGATKKSSFLCGSE